MFLSCYYDSENGRLVDDFERVVAEGFLNQQSADKWAIAHGYMIQEDEE